MTEVLVAGNVSTTAGAITMTASKVRGSVAASGAGVVTLTATTQNDNTFSVTAACAATNPVTPPATTAANFDALETNSVWIPTKDAHNPLYTKLAGAAFSLDIAALKTDGTLESAYVAVGASARYVKLELFDYTGAACSTYANPVATQTASFTSAALSIVPGRALSGAFIVDKVHSSLLVRIKECTDDSCTSFANTAAACSSDRFSVRPSALTLSTTTAMPFSEEPTATASQTIRAGADFTLFAKTSPVSGYAGVLTLDASKLTAQSPSQDESVQNGGAVGVLTPAALTANAAAVMASYSEAGYLYISAGAYRDDNFTAVDSAVGDCITSTVNNNYLADTLIDGKYGCSIGNKLTVRMGRFIPNHFSTEIVLDTVVLKNTVMPCPAGLVCPPGPSNVPPGFIIYARQPFTITVTARSLSGAPILNYRDKLAHDVTLAAWSTEGGAVAAGPTGSVLGYAPPVPAATFDSGVAGARPSYAFPTSYPATPLTAPTDIYLRATETGVTSDGVTSLRTSASSSIEAGIKVVSGRLHVANNYGSELLAVPVVVHAQYWDGTRFVNSSTDQKTSFASLDVTRSNCKKNLISGGNCKLVAITAPASPLTVNGMIRLTMAAPGAGNTGSVDLNISGFDWLPSTTARIGLGIYKATPVIYLREMY
jgi:MSHA biogenesis protein MshQ